MIADQSFQAWKGILCTLYAAAILSTGIRLIHRFKSRRNKRGLASRGHRRQSSSFSAHYRGPSVSESVLPAGGRSSTQRHARVPSRELSSLGGEDGLGRRGVVWFGMLGSDDLLAIVVSILGVGAAVIMVLLFQEKDSHQRISWQKGLYRAMVGCWVSIIWVSRISLALNLYSAFSASASSRTSSSRGSMSIPRPTSPNTSSSPLSPPREEGGPTGTLNNFSLLLRVAFCLLYLAHLFSSLVVGCTHYSRLRIGVIKSSAYCNAERDGAEAFGFVTIFISELALIGVAYAVRRSLPVEEPSHPESQLQGSSSGESRTVATSVMAAGILLLFSTIIHCAFFYSPLVTGTDGFIVVDMAGQLQSVFSIVACNIPVLVLWFRWTLYGEYSPSMTQSTPGKLNSFRPRERLIVAPAQKQGAQEGDDGDAWAIRRESVKVAGLPRAHAVHDTRFPSPKRTRF